MKPQDIHRFFEELDRRIDIPIQVLLTGGAAAILRGVRRATHDIDFEIKAKGRRPTVAAWEKLQEALAETGLVTGITPQYDEDIDRWNAIPLPTKNSRLYERIGKVEVRLLDVGLWAIGKLTRYLASDVEDLRIVLKKTSPDAHALAGLWGLALGMSPSSNMQALYSRQVGSFFDSYARDIWGPRADSAALKSRFLASARRRRALPYARRSLKK